MIFPLRDPAPSDASDDPTDGALACVEGSAADDFDDDGPACGISFPDPPGSAVVRVGQALEVMSTAGAPPLIFMFQKVISGGNDQQLNTRVFDPAATALLAVFIPLLLERFGVLAPTMWVESGGVVFHPPAVGGDRAPVIATTRFLSRLLASPLGTSSILIPVTIRNPPNT